MNFSAIFHLIMLNLIVFFTLESYTEYFSKKYIPKKKILLRKAFIIFNITYSFLPSFPYAFDFTVCCLSDFIYIYFTTQSKLKQKVLLSLRYWLFSTVASLVIYIIHSFITMDWIYSHENRLYYSYKEVICYFLIYVFLSTYISMKTCHYDRKERNTIHTFHILIIIMSIFISVIPLILKLENQDSQNILIFTFMALMVLILLIISLYKKLLVILDENMKAKIELEINHLTQEYSEKLEENITHLRKLRHDIKNHMIVIDGYAHENNTEKIISYIERMDIEYYSKYTIITPSAVVSSLLNSKSQLCQESGIAFSFSQSFSNIYFADFDILTILGNILDNAIRAAKKV